MMIDSGPGACFIKDSEGYLPAHVACSRRCTVQTLQMLLRVNPGALYEQTFKGDTLLSLAQKAKYRNQALIQELEALTSLYSATVAVYQEGRHDEITP